MITAELIEKINQLARKAKTVGLDAKEKEEQARLRQEYLAGIRERVINTLENVKIVHESDQCDSDCDCKHHH